MNLFETKGVSKQFSNHRALDRVSIGVPDGSIFGLLGPNGAGKTTLIRIINRIIAPDEGELFFEGRKLAPNDIGRIGYLPEERGLYKKMTVGEQSTYLARLKGLSKQEADKRLRYWFVKFEMQGWWNRKVEELSKGMQQKVQFVVTIVHEPKLLIFDEPFSGFDPINVNLLKEEILDLKKKGATIIFSTHNMASVEELCDHIALINKSKKILEGNMWEIKKTYKTNTFEVLYTGTAGDPAKFLPDSFELKEHGPVNEHFFARIRLPKEAKPNDLLSALLPHVSIIGLSEIIPSMNDIFIRAVTEQETIPSNSLTGES
ncbi:MAG TPA: ABC transporter ATP-binding protein [Bacteroidales bacterium]|nr:ABC transporter ATP-binding protein [Bacteroidales bacterium]